MMPDEDAMNWPRLGRWGHRKQGDREVLQFVKAKKETKGKL